MQGSTFFIHFHLNYYILTKKHLKHLQILVRKLQLILMCSYFIYFKPLQFSLFLGFDICLIFNVVFFSMTGWIQFHLLSSEIYLFNLNQQLKNGSQLSWFQNRSKIGVLFIFLDNSCVCFFPRTDEPSPTGLQATCIILLLAQSR